MAEAGTVKPYLVIAAACFILLMNASAPAAQPPAAVQPEDLQRARANLKLSEQTRDRIAAEVATLESSGKASADVVTAYRAYLERVEELVVEHRGVVARMEAACNAHRARSETAAAAPSSPPPAGSAENPSDRLDELDRRFNASLAAFDEMLLKELRLIQAAAAGRMKGMAEAAAAAGREAAEKGRKESPAGKGSAEETAGSRAEESGRGAGAERTETAGGRGAAGDAAGAGSQPPGGWGPGGTGAPGGSYRPDPDDDIVARQLREAAEKETDPELKAKLWKEYEEYQKSRVRP
ncbi:MAG: hypothetical protein MUC46_02335 [Desulfobacterales bacterium]|nr:hypothetical protein [Desulfobacterales bacterium]